MINQSDTSQTTSLGPRRLVLLGAGYVFFATGFIGIFLPVLPTTVFWIMATICFAKSSPAMYRRIVTWPGVGEIIADYIDHNVIRIKSKRIALAGMAVAAAILYFAGIDARPAAIAILGIACAALYVVTRPSAVDPARDGVPERGEYRR